ncbi:hypothetical protein F7725_008346, partial [Dissostichus mawsoni]
MTEGLWSERPKSWGFKGLGGQVEASAESSLSGEEGSCLRTGTDTGMTRGRRLSSRGRLVFIPPRLHFRGLLSKSLQVDLLGHPAFSPCALDDARRGCLDVTGPVLGALRPSRNSRIRRNGEKRVVGRRPAFLGEPSRSTKLRLGLVLGFRWGFRVKNGRQQIRRLQGFWVCHGIPGGGSLLLGQRRLLLSGLLVGPLHRHSLLIMTPALVPFVWAEDNRVK